jgi:hypothetical protein
MTTLRRFRWHAALLLLVGGLLAAVPAPATCGITDCLNCYETCEQRLAQCTTEATSPLSENNCYRASIACRQRCQTTMCMP